MTNKQYLAQCVIATSQGRARWVPSIKFSGTSAGKVWPIESMDGILYSQSLPGDGANIGGGEPE